MKKWIPAVITAVFSLYIISTFKSPPLKSDFDNAAFGRLPVLNGGRVKPLDTIGRTSLLLLSGKQTVSAPTRKDATEWLLDMLFMPTAADAEKVFEIDNPDVLGLFNIQQSAERRYSFATLAPHLAEIETQSAKAEEVKASDRSSYQRDISNLQQKLILYQKLQNTLQIPGAAQMGRMTDILKDYEKRILPAIQNHMKSDKKSAAGLKELSAFMEQFRFMSQVAEFLAVPAPGADKDPNLWTSYGDSLLGRAKLEAFPPSILSYAEIGDSYRAGDAMAFNTAVGNYRALLTNEIPKSLTRTGFEFVMNYAEPFYQSIIFYTLAFLLLCLSWLVWPEVWGKSAFYMLVLAFAVHTYGLGSRIFLQGRPPVTNLYSSAVFVGWGAVLLGIIVERLYKKGIGTLVASIIGLLTLIIAHHLAKEGDTMEMMRAVLDSNFWLATHVICITIGYSSTFLSGVMAIVYLIRRQFDSHWNKDSAEALSRMVYGIVCFSTFFSFLGTILGGIWADQSWGRFWGWDPKENGALMIVLWNVFILHARWGKIAKEVQVMQLAVVGNIVTSLSWFGVNMLGIGLHSYGFMDKAFVWLLVFSATQVLIILLGFLPTNSTRRQLKSRSH